MTSGIGIHFNPGIYSKSCDACRQAHIKCQREDILQKCRRCTRKLLNCDTTSAVAKSRPRTPVIKKHPPLNRIAEIAAASSLSGYSHTFVSREFPDSLLEESFSAGGTPPLVEGDGDLASSATLMEASAPLAAFEESLHDLSPLTEEDIEAWVNSLH